MRSEKTMFLIRNLTASLCLALALFSSPALHAAREISYSREIKQYVTEDKVYLLENIRQKVTIPSEKTVIDALLCEDGPKALSLYKKQLQEYPDPALDQLSRSRIAAYNLALESTAPLPKLSAPLPAPRVATPAIVRDTTKRPTDLSSRPNPEVIKESSKHITAIHPEARPSSPIRANREKRSVEPGGSTLQFGSFGDRSNAESLAKKISIYSPAEIIQQGQMYKVRLKKNFVSKEEASLEAKKIPVSAIVVPSM